MSLLMIVDDNKLFRTVLRSSLMHHLDPIDILEAGTAEKALAKISHDPPFLIFVDVQLLEKTDCNSLAKSSTFILKPWWLSVRRLILMNTDRLRIEL